MSMAMLTTGIWSWDKQLWYGLIDCYITWKLAFQLISLVKKTFLFYTYDVSANQSV